MTAGFILQNGSFAECQSSHSKDDFLVSKLRMVQQTSFVLLWMSETAAGFTNGDALIIIHQF